METRPILLAFNRGLVSPYALARVDLKRMALSAEMQTNWMPKVLGAMSLRPGTRLVRSTLSDQRAAHIPFVYSLTDTATLEFTNGVMRVDIGGTLVTYPATATVLPDFPAPPSHTFTATAAAPTVLTYTGTDDITSGDSVTLSSTGTLPAGLTAGTTYRVAGLNDTAKTFNLTTETSLDTLAATDTGSGTHTFTGGGGAVRATVTISKASPGVVTYAGNDNFADGDRVRLFTTGTLPAPLDANTEYYVVGLVAASNLCNLSLTSGGAAIATTTAGSGVHAMRKNPTPGVWEDSDEPGASSYRSAVGELCLRGSGVYYATRDTRLSVALADQGVEHVLRLRVRGAPVTLSIGPTFGSGSLVSRRVLSEGIHYAAFTPTTADVWVRLAASADYPAYVTEAAIVTGELRVPTPFLESDLPALRYDQSGDVVFIASGTRRQQRVERYTPRSWSVVDYAPADGPLRAQNTTPTRMSVSALSGMAVLTASREYFTASNVGSLFRLASAGQTVQDDLAAEDVYTGYIRVVGVGAGRSFLVALSGTWVGTVTLQRSVSEPGDWVDVKSWTANTSESYDDTLSNQTIYYRLGIKPTKYTSGTVTAKLSYASGTIQGVGRAVSFIDAKNMVVNVLKDFGSTSSTEDWWEGLWSPRRGYPSAVAFHDGRLWWAGKDKIASSVSDAFDTFDDNTEGDSGPILRSLGSGAVDTINWLMSLSSLLVGAQGREAVCKASSLDEPLTPSAFSLKTASTLGSAAVRAVQLDASGVFIHRNGSRLYEIALDSTTYNYVSNDLTGVVPEIGAAGFSRIAVQRTPDTRIHVVRPDGKVAILVFDRVEKVTCWVLYETDGIVEDVVVLPKASGDDQVSYVVARTINGVTKRYFETWAAEAETVGAATTVLADAVVTYSGASTTVIGGLSALEGRDVAVWGNSKDLGTYTVTAGSVTLPEAVAYALVGLPYTARFQSAKFSQASSVALGQRAQLHQLALILADTHAQGLRFGQDFDHLSPLPMVEKGALVDPDSIWSTYGEDSIPLDGTWSNDARLCLEAASPRPATVLAAVASVTGHDK